MADLAVIPSASAADPPGLSAGMMMANQNYAALKGFFGALPGGMPQIPSMYLRSADNPKIWASLWSSFTGLQFEPSEYMIKHLMHVVRITDILGVFPTISKIELLKRRSDIKFIGDNIQLNTWEFNPRVYAEKGQRSAGKIMQSKRHEETRSMSHFGGTIEAPMDFVADNSKALYVLKSIETMNDQVGMSWAFRTFETLTNETARDYVLRMRKQFQGPLTRPILQNMLLTENGRKFGLMKTGVNIEGYESYARGRMNERNVVPTHCLMTGGSVQFIKVVRAPSRQFFQRGQEIFNKNLGDVGAVNPAITPIYGLIIIESARFPKEDEVMPVDPTVKSTTVAHHWHVTHRHHQGMGRLRGPYTPEQLTIAIVDGDKGHEVHITAREMFNHCALFETMSNATTKYYKAMVEILCTDPTSPLELILLRQYNEATGESGNGGGRGPFDPTGLSNAPPYFGHSPSFSDEADQTQTDVMGDGVPRWCNGYTLFEKSGVLDEAVRCFEKMPEHAYKRFEDELEQQQRPGGQGGRRPMGMISSGRGGLYDRSSAFGAGSSGFKPMSLVDLASGSSAPPPSPFLLGGGGGGGAAAADTVSFRSKHKPKPRYVLPDRDLEANVRRPGAIIKRLTQIVTLLVPSTEDKTNRAAGSTKEYTIVNNMSGVSLDVEITTDAYGRFIHALGQIRKEGIEKSGSFNFFDGKTLEGFNRASSNISHLDPELFRNVLDTVSGEGKMSREEQSALSRKPQRLLWNVLYDTLMRVVKYATSPRNAADEKPFNELISVTLKLHSLFDPTTENLVCSNPAVKSFRDLVNQIMFRSKFAQRLVADVMNPAVEVLKDYLKGGSLAGGTANAATLAKVDGVLDSINKDLETANTFTNVLEQKGANAIDYANLKSLAKVLGWTQETNGSFPQDTDSDPNWVDNLNLLADEFLNTPGMASSFADKMALRKFIVLVLSNEPKDPEEKELYDNAVTKFWDEPSMVGQYDTPRKQLVYILKNRNLFLSTRDRAEISAQVAELRYKKRERLEDAAIESSSSDDEEEDDRRGRRKRKRAGASAGSAAAPVDKRRLAKDGSPVLREAWEILQMLYRMRLTKPFFNLLFDECVPLPFEFMLWQLWIHLKAGLIIIFRAGESTAIHVIGDAGVLFSQSTNTFTVQIGTRFTEGLFIVEHDNLEYIPHTYITALVSGAGTRLFNIQKDRAMFIAGGTPQFDLISTILPRKYENTTFFNDLRGELPSDLYSSEESQLGPMHPMAAPMREIFGMEKAYNIHPFSVDAYLAENLMKYCTMSVASSMKVWQPLVSASGNDSGVGTISRVIRGNSPISPIVKPEDFLAIRGALHFMGAGFEGTQQTTTLST